MIKSLTFVLLALVLSWSTAQAGDFCITETSAPSNVFIGKSFRIPPKGKCKAWIGFTPNIFTFPNTGSACTASDGSHVTFNIAATVLDGAADGEAAFFDVSLPSLTVTLAFDAQLGAGNGPSNTSTFTTATAGPCSPLVQPIP